MEFLGHHVLAEFYECDFESLDEVKKVEDIMIKAALKTGVKIRQVVFEKFFPRGVSGVIVIPESQLAIHTWPELGYAAVDIFTCGQKDIFEDVCNYLIKDFGSGRINITTLNL